ncbi:piggyBac transposable element-derived protein 4-like [Schistocerca piceifrons]|uniref:piggyBac transposable element-derived protein 4-like n=1 Tax=Schistocerca piceifrons TaxID=274613 RepID=UPI001F5F1258|nr:piggyBac transposable element-derived protein 4-like [Schistocerca piceifrons]
MLLSFRGWCSFIQYKPAKLVKYGLKLYDMCNSRMYYVHNSEIYCGKQREDPYFTWDTLFNIIKRLVQPILGSHRNVTTDNYYTVYPLAHFLLENGVTFLCTMKKKSPQTFWI